MSVRAFVLAAACLGCVPSAYYPAVAGTAGLAQQTRAFRTRDQLIADELERQRLQREAIVQRQAEAMEQERRENEAQAQRVRAMREAERAAQAPVAPADPPAAPPAPVPPPPPAEPEIAAVPVVAPSPAPPSPPAPRKPRRKAPPKPTTVASPAMSKAEQEAYDAETARRAAAAAKAKSEVASEAPVKPSLDECGDAPERSGWDGLPIGLKSAYRAYARENYGDPDSIEIVSCIEVSRTAAPKCWMTMCKVRGKNAFGAKILNVKIFGKSARGWKIYGD